MTTPSLNLPPYDAKRQQDADKERKAKQQAWEELMGAMVKEAANIIAGPAREDVALTIEGAIITVLAANRANNQNQWVIALNALGDILKTIAQRESGMIHEAALRRERELEKARLAKPAQRQPQR